MPIATNPDSGEAVFLDSTDNQWKPAQTAVNPDTREVMAFDGQSWQKVTSHGKGFADYVDDAVRSIASGATFGYADEIAAKMDELTGRGGSYEKNLAKEKSRDQAIPAAISIPGQITGAVASTVAAAPVRAAVGGAGVIAKLPAWAKNIVGGAAAGGVYASGEAEPGLENRLAAAVPGAAGGAVLGGLLSGVGAAAKAYFKPGTRATEDLMRAIERDGDTPDSLTAKLTQVQQDRPGATLADVGGENVKGLLERVAQTPGAGRTSVVPFLTDRQSSQMTRLAGDLSDLAGTKQSAVKATSDIIEQRGKDATPLYQAAYEAGDKPIWSPGLERLSASPTVQAAMKGAVRIWQDVAVADGYGAMNPGAMVENGGVLKFLNGKVPAFPNLQFWDYTKRIIDDQVGVAVRAGENQKAKTLTKLNQVLRGELDAAVPEYQSARQSWAGPSAYLNSIEDGRGALSRNMSAEEMAANFKVLSPSEQEGYRIGMVSSIISKMGNDAAKLADLTKYLRSPENRAKIAAIMPTPEAAQSWSRRLGFEVGSSELTGRSLGNSSTFRRLAEKESGDGVVGDLVMSAFAGTPPVGLFKKVVMGGASKVRDTVRSRADKELADMLLSKTQLGKSALIPQQ